MQGFEQLVGKAGSHTRICCRIKLPPGIFCGSLVRLSMKPYSSHLVPAYVIYIIYPSSLHVLFYYPVSLLLDWFFTVTTLLGLVVIFVMF